MADLDHSETEIEQDELTEKGKRMAASLAEYVMMRYFFPEIKDRRKQAVNRQNFMVDMQFNLCKGTVQRATEKFRNRHFSD